MDVSERNAVSQLSVATLSGESADDHVDPAFSVNISAVPPAFIPPNKSRTKTAAAASASAASAKQAVDKIAAAAPTTNQLTTKKRPQSGLPTTRVSYLQQLLGPAGEGRRSRPVSAVSSASSGRSRVPLPVFVPRDPVFVPGKGFQPADFPVVCSEGGTTSGAGGTPVNVGTTRTTGGAGEERSSSGGGGEQTGGAAEELSSGGGGEHGAAEGRSSGGGGEQGYVTARDKRVMYTGVGMELVETGWAVSGEGGGMVKFGLRSPGVVVSSFV